MGGPFLQRLRVETRPAHDLVERVPALARLMAPDLDRATYVGVLQGLHRFHAGLHTPLANALSPLPDAAPYIDATRLDALEHDLAQLDTRPGPPADPESLPSLPTAAHALGCLYVIEGSTLGGRVIARRLRDALSLDPTNGAAFYGARSADETRTRFLALVAILEAAAIDPAHAGAILEAAIDTFDCFTRFMGRTAPQSYFSTNAFSIT